MSLSCWVLDRLLYPRKTVIRLGKAGLQLKWPPEFHQFECFSGQFTGETEHEEGLEPWEVARIW